MGGVGIGETGGGVWYDMVVGDLALNTGTGFRQCYRSSEWEWELESSSSYEKTGSWNEVVE